MVIIVTQLLHTREYLTLFFTFATNISISCMCGSFQEIFQAFDTILYKILRVITLKNQAGRAFNMHKSRTKIRNGSKLKILLNGGFLRL